MLDAADLFTDGGITSATWTKENDTYVLDVGLEMRRGRATERVEHSAAMGLLRLERRIYGEADARSREEIIEFASATHRLPDHTYVDTSAPFVLGTMPFDGKARSMYLWICDRFVAKVYYESHGNHSVTVPAGRFETTEVARGQIGLGFFRDGGEPTKLVGSGELAGDLERGRFPRGELRVVSAAHEHQEQRTARANELLRHGAIPRTFRGHRGNDRYATRGSSEANHLCACSGVARNRSEAELGRDFAEQRCASARVGFDRGPSGSPKTTRRVREDRSMHVFRCTHDHHARLRRDDPFVELLKSSQGPRSGLRRRGNHGEMVSGGCQGRGNLVQNELRSRKRPASEPSRKSRPRA